MQSEQLRNAIEKLSPEEVDRNLELIEDEINEITFKLLKEENKSKVRELDVLLESKLELYVALFKKQCLSKKIKFKIGKTPWSGLSKIGYSNWIIR